jgi:hypothetical protein
VIVRYILLILAIALPIIFFVNQATVKYYRKKVGAETKEMDKSVANLGCGIVALWIAVVVTFIYLQFSYLDPVISTDDKALPDSGMLRSVKSVEAPPSNFDPYADTVEEPKPVVKKVYVNYPVYHDLHLLFEGQPSEKSVKSIIRSIMKKYGMPDTETNVRQIASVVIEERKKSEMIDFSEMALLRHILRYGTENYNFSYQAAISAGILGKSQLRNHNRRYDGPGEQQSYSNQ